VSKRSRRDRGRRPARSASAGSVSAGQNIPIGTVQRDNINVQGDLGVAADLFREVSWPVRVGLLPAVADQYQDRGFDLDADLEEAGDSAVTLGGERPDRPPRPGPCGRRRRCQPGRARSPAGPHRGRRSDTAGDRPGTAE